MEFYFACLTLPNHDTGTSLGMIFFLKIKSSWVHTLRIPTICPLFLSTAHFWWLQEASRHMYQQRTLSCFSRARETLYWFRNLRSLGCHCDQWEYCKQSGKNSHQIHDKKFGIRLILEQKLRVLCWRAFRMHPLPWTVPSLCIPILLLCDQSRSTIDMLNHHQVLSVVC